MNISITISELRSLLDTVPASQNIMLTGRHGIGKSETLTTYFKEKGMKVVALFLGQMSDPGDLIGLPTLNAETDRMDFTPPYWFPKENEPVVLFLDELNRARPEILQVIMDLALNRKLAGRMLPEGSRIISAVNAGEQYQLTDLDPALVSRFNIYNFAPSVSEWLLWAKKKGLDERVLSFIESDQGWLDGDPTAKADEDTGLDKTPDRRAWEKVSDIIKGQTELSPLMSKVIAGVIGAKATSAFIQSAGQKRLVGAKEVLKRFASVRDTLMGYDLKELTSVTDSIFRLLEVEKVPADKVSTVADSLDKYFDMLSKHKKESSAYFVSQYSDGQYPNAVKFIANNATLLAMSLNVYIRSISTN